MLGDPVKRGADAGVGNCSGCMYVMGNNSGAPEFI